ncbi:putative phage abortive infection protein [Arcobacter lacus]|uniref:putative phage abortive infection protein n=1 Tax=Arcobacter lacus TaxID=1912876 RepID=UPI0021BA4737|nr:putative phage abortive infection protein [Arcobacter lacus]MCT7911620.1 putative phage abortive infection protein [Arcobacter lacus]
MKILLIIFSLIAIFAVIILSAFFYGITQNPNFEEIIKIWANFGDFMGGTLNPILAALSLFGLLFTIYYQNRELEETRKELKKSTQAQREQSESLKLQNEATKLQIFENTFFQLNKVFFNTKNGLSIKVDIFENNNGFINGGGGQFTEYSGIHDDDFYILDCIKTSTFLSHEVIEKYLTIFKKRYKKWSYDEFNENYERFTGTYFGQIYQILKFVDNSNIENKQRYVNIFRAQFTKQELEFLFYHCLGSIGKRRFKKLVEDYEFFEHIVLNEDIEKKLLEYHKNAFGKNEKILEKYNELKESKE